MGDVEMEDAPMIIEGSAPPPPQHDPSDPDPIKATYDVYIKPSISDGRQIYVLQFPNRGPKAPYRKEHHTQPTKLRLKPQAGMVELDVPVDAWRNYDRGKGIKWGDAMKQSNSIPGGKSYGLPGGFGIGGNQPGRGRGRGEVAVAVDQERLLRDYASAIHTDRVLTKQTLGGQTVLNEDTTPQYMIGTFRQNQLHLIPADHIVQMRPQFHHIDAHTEQERSIRARDPTAPPSRVIEARAVHMTVKNPVDGEEDTTDTMAERIIATQGEPWKHHQYIDEDDTAAWESFGENLFVGGPIEEVEDLQNKVPTLSSAFDDTEYLNLISTPRDASKLSTSKKVRTSGKGKEKAGTVVEEQSDDSFEDISSDSDLEERPAETILPIVT